MKNGLLVSAFIILALTACGIPLSHIDWIDFIQFKGIQYIAVGHFGQSPAVLMVNVSNLAAPSVMTGVFIDVRSSGREGGM